MSDENPDDFDALIAEQQDDGEEQKIGMVVMSRCKGVLDENGNVVMTASEVIEAEERAYLGSLLSSDLNAAALPIPFFSEGADVCDPPTKADAADLLEKFGITAQEYQELMS
jgi:hypothetical protein